MPVLAVAVVGTGVVALPLPQLAPIVQAHRRGACFSRAVAACGGRRCRCLAAAWRTVNGSGQAWAHSRKCNESRTQNPMVYGMLG